MPRDNRKCVPFRVARALGLALALSPLYAQDAKAERNGNAEVEGTVTSVTGSCPTLRFAIAGTQVVTRAETKFEDGSCTDVANGRRVEVEGQTQEDGTLVAKEVDLD